MARATFAQVQKATHLFVAKNSYSTFNCNSVYKGEIYFSGKLYQFCQYGVREDNGRIDYDQLAETAQREKPRMITVGASAY